MNKKGIYGIFTSFLFIIISLLFLFALLFYQNIQVQFRGEFHSSSSEFQILSDTKEKIFECYGNPINLDLSLSSSYVCENILVKKYVLTRIQRDTCNYATSTETIKNGSIDKIVTYYVPMKKSSTSSVICLGTLTLYI